MYKPTFVHNSKLNNFKNQKPQINFNNLEFYVNHALPEDSTITNNYNPLNWTYDSESETLSISSNQTNRKYIGVRIDPPTTNDPPIFGNSSATFDPYDNEKKPKCRVP